jgi:hypothetical protein
VNEVRVFCFSLGNLIQVTESRKGKSFGGISLKSSETRKESVRQCFLFSSYMLLTSRSSSGRLHLGKVSNSIKTSRSVFGLQTSAGITMVVRVMSHCTWECEIDVYCFDVSLFTYSLWSFLGDFF